MKKIASIFMCLMLVASMTLTGIVSASAAAGSGILKVVKYEEGTATPTGNYDEFGNETYDYSTAVAVKDAEFTAYPLLVLGDDGRYSIHENFTGCEDFTMSDILKTDDLAAGNGADGYLTYGDTDALEAMITTLENYIRTNGAKASATVTTDSNGVGDFGSVGYGVYLVVETKVPSAKVNGTDEENTKQYVASTKSFLVAVNAEAVDENNTVVAYPKNDPITVNKVIVKDNTDTKAATFAIGQKVDYKVVSQVPKYSLETLADYKEAQAKDDSITDLPYVFTDTFSGLTYIDGSLKVMVGSDDCTSDFTVEVNNNTVKFVSTFEKVSGYTVATDAAVASYPRMGSEVTVTYSAYVNESAKIGPEGNPNDINLSFASDPAAYKVDPTPVTVENEEEPVVYTYQLNINKTFNEKTVDAYNALKANDKNVDATSVKFEIYTEASNASTRQAIKFFKVSDGKYKVNLEEKIPGKTNITEVALDSAGHIELQGLDAGTYYIKEVATDSSFTKLTSDIKLVIAPVLDENGKVTGKATFETYKLNQDTGKYESASTETANNGVGNMTINNARKQFDLPLTGGLGLWIFTIAGGVVMAGAIIFFAVIRKKKRIQ